VTALTFFATQLFPDKIPQDYLTKGYWSFVAMGATLIFSFSRWRLDTIRNRFLVIMTC